MNQLERERRRSRTEIAADFRNVIDRSDERDTEMSVGATKASRRLAFARVAETRTGVGRTRVDQE